MSHDDPELNEHMFEPREHLSLSPTLQYHQQGVAPSSSPRRMSASDAVSSAALSASQVTALNASLRWISVPRPISPQRLEGEALADSPENVTFDDACRRHRLCDRPADMGEPDRTAGQEYGVDIFCG